MSIQLTIKWGKTHMSALKAISSFPYLFESVAHSIKQGILANYPEQTEFRQSDSVTLMHLCD